MTQECGKKRVIRCYKKMKEFLKVFNSTEFVSNHNLKFILPIFMNHLDILPLEEISELINKNEKFLNGFLVIMESYKTLNLEKIQKYKNFIENKLNSHFVVKFGQGHPSIIY